MTASYTAHMKNKLKYTYTTLLSVRENAETADVESLLADANQFVLHEDTHAHINN